MKDRWIKWREAFGSETDYIIRLWSCFSDPEQQDNFLETLRERKRDNPGYSIYDDYPRSENAVVRAREECVNYVKSLNRPKVKDDKEESSEKEEGAAS